MCFYFCKEILGNTIPMLYWTLQISCISIVLIFILHQLLHYLKTTLTTPKFVDLVNITPKRYETMFQMIHKDPCYSSDSASLPVASLPVASLPVASLPVASLTQSEQNSSTSIHDLSNMKNELDAFVKENLLGQ